MFIKGNLLESCKSACFFLFFLKKKSIWYFYCWLMQCRLKKVCTAVSWKENVTDFNAAWTWNRNLIDTWNSRWNTSTFPAHDLSFHYWANTWETLTWCFKWTASNWKIFKWKKVKKAKEKISVWQQIIHIHLMGLLPLLQPPVLFTYRFLKYCRFGLVAGQT